MEQRSYKLADLIDVEAVRQLMADFHAATGFVVGIVDTDGQLLVQVGYRDICTEFHRGDPRTERRCIESDLHLAREAKHGTYAHYTCANGLTDAASPIVVDGEHLANIYTGQFFFEPPDEECFLEQAEQFGFDRDAYLASLRKVPVVSHAEYDAAMSFLTRFGRMLGELGLKAKRQKEAEAALVQMQKMEAVGRLASSVAHDFNNLLQAILGFGAEVLEEVSDRAEVAEMQEGVLEAGRRAEALVTRLLAFSRSEELQPEYVNLTALVRELLQLAERLLGEHIEVELVGAEQSTVFVDPRQMEQVVLNLCVNARDAMTGGGRISIEVRDIELDEAACLATPELSPGAHVMLSLADDGPGIPETVLPRIFEPFFTTKERHQGTGLGLATAQSIVRRHGGAILVESRKGEGSCFRIYLPATSGVEVENLALGSEAKAQGGTETVLLAEDDELARRLAFRILSGAGYKVLVAKNGPEAKELVRDRIDQIDLLVLDVLMPGCTGRDVYEAARARRPTLPVLFCSGYSADLLQREYLVALPAGTLLQKPFSSAKLLREVRRLLDSGDARQ